MTWRVGIDEAGYGPNLGPFVMSSAAVFDPGGADLWQTVGAGRAGGDGLVIDDSKRVYANGRGFGPLERAALMLTPAATVGDYVAAHDAAELPSEPWFDGPQPLPAAERHPAFGPARTWALTAAAFNAVLDRHGTKSAPCGLGLVALVRWYLAALPGDDPIEFTIDRQGGRLYYAPLLQETCPGAWVRVGHESASECRYSAELPRRVTWVVRPKADGTSLPVALASMCAKYLREVAMGQFNRYWLRHVPGLAPTAGYPVDARRYFDAIRPAMERLGIAVSAVWRQK